MSYEGMLYFKPVPVDLNSLEKKLGGRIIENTLVLDDIEINGNGIFRVHAPDQETAVAKLNELLERIQSLAKIQIVGIGTYNSKGKLQVFFPLVSDAIALLENMAKEILFELGLSEASALSQARVIANEILCGIIGEGKVVGEGMLNLGLRDYTQYSGLIVID